VIESAEAEIAAIDLIGHRPAAVWAGIALYNGAIPGALWRGLEPAP
jgi:hypothetical protein